MYPLKVEKKRNRVLVEEAFDAFIDIVKTVFGSLKSPRQFILLLKKSFYF